MIFFLLKSTINYSQTEIICGTPPRSDAEMQIIKNISDNADQQQTANAGSTQYQIPIHVHILKDDNFVEPVACNRTLDKFATRLEEANNYFTNNMSFFICKESEVVDDILFGSTISSSNIAALKAQSNYDLNALNVYLVPSASGAGVWFRQEEALVLSTGMLATTIAHELGHAFGLEHTFRYTVYEANPVIGLDEDCVRLYPDNSCTDICIIDCFTLGCPEEEIIMGECTGDFILDTDVDISHIDDDDGGGIATGFCIDGNIPCIVEIDGVDQYYYLPYNNLMSYFPDIDHFTAGQLTRMMEVLLDSENGMYHLVNPANMPNCDNIEIDPDFSLLVDHGKVERIKVDTDGNVFNDPLEGKKLKGINFNNDDNFPFSPTDSDGNYELGDVYVCDVVTDIVSAPENTSGNFSPLNGVTTYDMIKILRHNLGIEPFNNSYSKIAADVNYSGHISIADMIKIRKLILGIDESEDFSPVPSWRLLPRYALDDQWGFAQNFHLDPFSDYTTWTVNNENRKYKPESGQKSYLEELSINVSSEDANNIQNWSFYAIKTGDVNFSAMSLDEEGPEPLFGQIASSPHSCIQAGAKFGLKFITSGLNWQDNEGYQIDLQIMGNKAEISGIGAGDLSWFSLDNFNKVTIASGDIRTLWYSRDGLPEDLIGKTLFVFDMVSNEEICDIASIFEIDNSRFNSEIYDYQGNTFGIELQLEVLQEDRKHTLNNVYPNTYSNQVSFDFKLDNPEVVNIRLWDQNGNILEVEDSFQQGNSVFVIDNTNNLQQGAIYYRILLGTEEHTGNLIKL